jgi:hypothetical protein
LGGGTQANGSNGNGNGSGKCNCQAELQAIYDVLDSVLNPAESIAYIEYQTLAAGGVVQSLYGQSKKVKKAIIMNISADPVTLFSSGSGSIGKPSGTISQGIILNPQPSAGQGGGTFPTGNVDLGSFSWVALTTGDAIAVYYET